MYLSANGQDFHWYKARNCARVTVIMTIDEHALLRSASRTFALSIERLPGVVGEAMCLAYLLLRVSDFLEDNDYMPPERKVALLKLWDRALAGDEAAETLVAELADHDPGDDP